MTTKSNTITIGGRKVKLTKSGLPNKVYLTKEEKEVVEAYETKLKKEKKEMRIKELTDVLNTLKK
jgi:hypothetical protein